MLRYFNVQQDGGLRSLQPLQRRRQPCRRGADCTLCAFADVASCNRHGAHSPNDWDDIAPRSFISPVAGTDAEPRAAPNGRDADAAAELRADAASADRRLAITGADTALSPVPGAVADTHAAPDGEGTDAATELYAHAAGTGCRLAGADVTDANATPI